MIILHTEASPAWGGQEIRILRESIGMRERGHRVIIAARPGSDLLRHAGKEKFETIPVDFKRRNFLQIVFFFKKLIEREKVDIVNTHSSKDSWLVLPASRLAKNRPLTLRTRHLSTPVGKNISTHFLYNILPHYVITTGEAIKDQMVNSNGFNPERIVSIPTGVDPDVYNPDAKYTDIRKELNLDPSTPLVGAVAVIRNWKGLDYLVKAAPIILKERPDVRFVIAGGGPDIDILRDLVSTTAGADKVFVLGHRDDILNVFGSIDILVHPSYANEGVPQTILQAMAMKKPVVASALLPLQEIVIDNETGLLARIKDPENIAAAVIKLLRDNELSQRLGESGRRFIASSYLFTHMLDKLEYLYGKKKNDYPSY